MSLIEIERSGTRRNLIPTIGTEGLRISTYEKCASSKLMKFFSSRNPIFTHQQPIETIDDEKIIIIVTRNELDRWCAGVTQDLDDYFITEYTHDIQYAKIIVRVRQT